jgi:hypothetical protein
VTFHFHAHTHTLKPPTADRFFVHASLRAGNKHKKLAFISLGAVPLVVQLLAAAGLGGTLAVQSATAVGRRARA